MNTQHTGGVEIGEYNDSQNAYGKSVTIADNGGGYVCRSMDIHKSDAFGTDTKEKMKSGTGWRGKGRCKSIQARQGQVSLVWERCQGLERRVRAARPWKGNSRCTSAARG